MKLRNRLRPIETREFTRYVKNNYNSQLIGVEIGVLQGGNASMLLSLLKNSSKRKLLITDRGSSLEMK